MEFVSQQQNLLVIKKNKNKNWKTGEKVPFQIVAHRVAFLKIARKLCFCTEFFTDFSKFLIE